MITFSLEKEFIKLGQLLKASGIAESGSFAKIMILNGEVKVNGEVVYERGKKIHKGDVIEVEEEDTVIVE